jgi:TatD DNase family protein
MKIFESHCHLDDQVYDKDLAEVLIRAENAGVKAMMIVGVDKKSSQKAVSIAKTHANVFASVGVHPHDAKTCSEAVLADLQTLSESIQVCGWGEIGLDFNRMYSPKNVQERWFARQLELSDRLDLPVILHERDSNGRLLEMLKAHGETEKKRVVHCFSGTEKELMAYLDEGLYIGITGILTMRARGAELRRLAAMMPIDRILIETDAPFLTPAPQRNRHRRNEPAFLTNVLTTHAHKRNEEIHYLADVIWENSCLFFGVDPKPET